MQIIYGKIFNFPKQHAPAHIVYDIVHKGATCNYNTRVGEGFQQESSQAYLQTNFKKVEKQVSPHNFLLVDASGELTTSAILLLDDMY